MNHEELYHFFKRFDDQMKAMEANGQAFHQKLRHDLFDLVFAHWPELKTYREEMEKPLLDLATRSAHEAMECLNVAEYYWRTGDPVPKVRPVPKPLTAQDAEDQVQKFIREYPDVDPEEWRQVVWEDFEWEMKANHFLHRIHHAMKQALTDFYLDNLLRLEAGQLLLLDEYLYMIGAHQYAQEVYELEEAVKK